MVLRLATNLLQSRILSKFAGPAMFSAVNLLKTPYCGNYDAKFGSLVGKIVSE
jgi:hypothetical protein